MKRRICRLHLIVDIAKEGTACRWKLTVLEVLIFQIELLRVPQLLG